MKLRNIFTMFASLLALAFTSCEVEEGRFLDEVKVSQSYVAIPAEGGTVEVTVDAADAWEITGVPEWLTVNPLKGEAGQTIVKFTAEPATSTNEAQVTLNCAGASQIISVLQMTEKIEPPLTELNTILTSGEVGVFYRVKGTVAEVPLKDFQSYGKFYITDSSTDSKVQIYGLANKAEYLDKSNNPTIDVGDVVVIEGSWSSYSNFNNDTKILSVEKSLIKIESVEYVSNSDAETPEAGEGDAPAEGEGEGEEEAAPSELSKEGGKVIVTLTVKGDGVSVDIPEEAKAWLSIAGLTTSGTTAVVTFDAAANQAGDRTVDISFLTISEGVEYSALTTIAQKGSILNATIPEFLAAAEDATLYRISGNIKSLSVSDQYHNANITIVDGAGNEAYLYRLVSNEKNIEELGLKEGDYLTVVGKRSSYNGSPQMAQGCYIESYVSYVPATISEFLAAEVSDVMYRVSGVIVNIKEVNTQYGNANLTIADDAGNELYIYRMKPAEGGKAIDEIGFKEGDVLTVVGKRSEYNGSPQMGSPVYVSHEEGAAPMPELEKSEWALVGSFNGWDPASDAYLSVLDEEYFVYYGFELASDTEFKFLKGGAWPPTGQEVGGNGLVEPNTIQPAGGSNIKATKAGKYDIYLTADLTKFYIMDEGKLPSEATEPAPVENSWGMMGMFADNVWVSDIPMTKEGNWIVAKGAQFTELKFKIRANASWADATNIGVAPGSAKGELNTAIPVVTAADSKANHGGDAADIELNGEAGTYDVYFSFEKMEVWVMTPGNTPGASEEPAPEDPTTLTLTNEEICAAMTASNFTYSEYTIESESGVWTVNASRSSENTFLQCRGKKGGYIKTPAFENDIKSVTIHFTDKKSVYANNVYCAFPASWTVPTEDAAYPEDGNVGRAVTDGSYSVTIPVEDGNKQVYVSIIGTYSYYVDHIDVEF